MAALQKLLVTTAIAVLVAIPRSSGFYLQRSYLQLLQASERKLANSAELYLSEETRRTKALPSFFKAYIHLTKSRLSRNASALELLSAAQRSIHFWNILSTPTELDVAVNVSSVALPQRVDRHRAIKAVCSLQTFYNLSGSVLREFIGKSCLRVQPADLTEIGASAEEFQLARCSVEFLHLALDAWNSMGMFVNDFHLRMNLARTLDVLSVAHHLLGNDREALEYGLRYQKMIPGSEQMNANIRIYQNHLRNPSFRHTSLLQPTIHPASFAGLCDNDVHIPWRLRCELKTFSKPRFLLSPLRVEWLSRRPLLILIHNFVTDATAQRLINGAADRMVLDVEYTPEDNTGVPFRARETVNVPKNDSVEMAHIVTRIEDVTDLSAAFSRAVQINHYGPDGYRQVEPDFFSAPEDIERFGNVYGTFVIFLSDSEARTVFPKLRLYVPPRRGNALFYYSLSPRLIGDPRTINGDCPVLGGSKWTLELSFNQLGQELIMPCPMYKVYVPVFV